MSDGYYKQELHLRLSPKKLRDWADKMDAVWPKLNLGDSTCIEVFPIDGFGHVFISLDQEYFHKLEKVERIFKNE